MPSSKLDENINIGTWNIRDFGKVPREDISIHYIAEIISNFDLIALTEVRADITDLSKVLKILGSDWKVVFSDPIMDYGGNKERIAYVYDERAVKFTGLAAEVNMPRKKIGTEYVSEKSFWRMPYVASFVAGRFDFILVTAHIRWGSRVSERVPPLKYLAEWIDERKNSSYTIDKDIILTGDFNIPSRGSSTFKAITSKGLQIPDALLDVDATNLKKENPYDQILHYPTYTSSFTENGGIVDFYKENWRALYPKRDYPEMTYDKFTYQLSDHFPLWIEINTWTDDEELDQLLLVD